MAIHAGSSFMTVGLPPGSSFSGSQRISPARDWKRPCFVLTPEWPDLDTCTQKHPGRPKIERIGTVLNVEAWCSGAFARVANDLNDHRGRAYEEECVEGRIQDFRQSHQHLDEGDDDDHHALAALRSDRRLRIRDHEEDEELVHRTGDRGDRRKPGGA